MVGSSGRSESSTCACIQRLAKLAIGHRTGAVAAAASSTLQAQLNRPVAAISEYRSPCKRRWRIKGELPSFCGPHRATTDQRPRTANRVAIVPKNGLEDAAFAISIGPGHGLIVAGYFRVGGCQRRNRLRPYLMEIELIGGFEGLKASGDGAAF